MFVLANPYKVVGMQSGDLKRSERAFTRAASLFSEHLIGRGGGHTL